MNDFFLSLVINKEDSLPFSIREFKYSSLERHSKHSSLRLSLSVEQEHKIYTALQDEEIDFALIPFSKIDVKKKLVLFDMDSTLIQNEVIVEMAKLFDKGPAVKEITERAMNGELNFDEALKARVALLKGLDKDELPKVLSVLKVTPGVPEFVAILKKHNIKTAVVSGGFQLYADHFKELLQLDYAYANELEFADNKLTGNLLGPIVNAEKKVELLLELAQKENATIEQTVAIGDGANDIPMLKKAGLGFAFHAKDKVRRETRHQVNHSSMQVIGYYLNLE